MYVSSLIPVTMFTQSSNIYALAQSVFHPLWPYSYLILIILFIISINLIIKRFNFVNSLKSVPGPEALPVVGNALSLTKGQDDFFQYLIKQEKIHGPIFRLWVGMRPFVFISKANYVQPLLNSSQHMDKSYEYSFLLPWLGNGIITTTGSTWHQKRKLLTPAFHSSILEDFSDIIYEESQVLVKKLETNINKGYFDVLPYTKLCSLDVICCTAMGKKMHVQSNENKLYVEAVDGLKEVLQRRFITPWIKPDAVFYQTSWGKRQKKYVAIIQDFCNQVLKERKESFKSEQLNNGNYDKKKRLAFLDLLLKCSEDGHMLNDQDVIDEVNTFMFAGHDTVSLAVAWCLYLLGQHPEAQDKILQEFKTIQPNTNKMATLKTLQKLEYLERCIKETLRLFPIVPLIARDLKLPLQVEEHVLPPGVTVLVNQYLLHRDPTYFENPDEFQPDRFLQENSEGRHPFAYIPFSAGLRNCIGSKFAMLEVKQTLLSVLSKFLVSSDSHEELRLYAEIVLINVGGIKISLQPRV